MIKNYVKEISLVLNVVFIILCIYLFAGRNDTSAQDRINQLETQLTESIRLSEDMGILLESERARILRERSELDIVRRELEDERLELYKERDRLDSERTIFRSERDRLERERIRIEQERTAQSESSTILTDSIDYLDGIINSSN